MSQTKSVRVTYNGGHSRISKWYYWNEMFCPECGHQGIWMEDDMGDYYVGSTHVCINCSSSFTIQGPEDGNDIDMQVIAGLK